MTPESFLPMLGLAFAAAWTPGPNNALVAHSGVAFGLGRTMPHVLGIALGFPLMVFVVGLLLGQTFQSSGLLQGVLRWGGAALLLWMGWRIARAGAVEAGAGPARPFSFLQAAAFQWINPKGWVMALSITSLYVARDAPALSALIIAATFVGMGFSSAFGWACSGHALAGWLGTGARLRVFNIVMGAMVAAGAVVLIVE